MQKILEEAVICMEWMSLYEWVGKGKTSKYGQFALEAAVCMDVYMLCVIVKGIVKKLYC